MLGMCKYGLLPLMLLATGLLTLASVGQAQGLWWQVDTDAGAAFLGGSVHLGNESMYPLPDEIMAAFDAADMLVVEIDILNTNTMAVIGQLVSQGFYRDGSTLASQLAPNTWALFQQTLERLRLPELIFRWQKPWFAALNLSLLAFHEAGYREDLGIDFVFLQAATETAKPIVELETLQQQLGLFTELSAAEQELFLQQTLMDLQDAPGYLDAIIEAWQAGDPEAMAALIHQSRDSETAQRLFERFIDARNITMAEAIEALFVAGHRPFVVVGAGHLVGPGSVVKRLRQAGYRVQLLSYEATAATVDAEGHDSVPQHPLD